MMNCLVDMDSTYNQQLSILIHSQLSNPYHQKWHKKSLSPSDLNHPWYCQRHSKPMHVLLVHMALGEFGPRPKKI